MWCPSLHIGGSTHKKSHLSFCPKISFYRFQSPYFKTKTEMRNVVGGAPYIEDLGTTLMLSFFSDH